MPEPSTSNLTKHNFSSNLENVSSHSLQNLQPNKKLSYLSLMDNLFTYTKEYISTKIKNENPEIKTFIIPREKLYQMIVIIDKLDLQNLAELQYVPNFGVTIEDYTNLKGLTKIGNFDKNEMFKIYDGLELIQLLYLYKYFYIALAKIKNLFYRLEVDQIQENLYNDFVTIDRKKKILKLDNQPFADFDPIKDKDINYGNKDNETNTSKTKLNFSENKKVEHVASKKHKKKGKFDNFEDFPGKIIN